MWQHRTLKKRKAVAGIVSALILFVMLFTVGTGYFLWVSTNNGSYSRAQASRVLADQEQQTENVIITPACCILGNLTFTATNSGGTPVALVANYVNDASGTTFYKTFSGLMVLNPGNVSQPISTNCNRTLSCNIASAAVKVLTQRGSVFAGSYPPPTTPTTNNTALSSLISGAIGDLQISFTTYRYYNVTNSGCPAVADSSGYCFATVPGLPSFTIKQSIASTGNIAFSIRVTNFSPSKFTITLDPFTFIAQFGGVGSSSKTAGFFIVSNSSRTILNHFTPISLEFNKTKTLIFAAANCVLITSSPKNPPEATCTTFKNFSWPGGTGGGGPVPGDIFFVAIFTHGWKGLTVPPYVISKTNYGQNIPFVTTLYW